MQIKLSARYLVSLLVFTFVLGCGSKKDSASSPSTGSGDGGGGGGGGTHTVDSSSSVFNFTVQEFVDPANATNPGNSIPSAGSPTINTGSLINSLATPSTPTYLNLFPPDDSGSVTTSNPTVINMGADNRSHQVILSAAVNSCTTANSLSCAVNSGDNKILDLSSILYSALTIAMDYFTFSINGSSVNVPIQAYSAKYFGDINAINDNFSVRELVEIGDYIYAIDFRVISGSTIKRLVKINKTDNTTQMLLQPEPAGGRVDFTTAFNGNLYMSANVSAGTKYLLKYNPSNNTFSNLSGAGTTLTSPRNFTVFNSQLFFAAKDANGRDRLYKLDASDNISQVFELCSGQSDGLFKMVSTASGLYVDVSDPNSCGNNFIITRLNTNGTATPLFAATGNGFDTVIRDVFSYKSKIHFVAENGMLFSDDGGGAITNLNGSQFHPTTYYRGGVVGNHLYFTNQNNTARVWHLDDSGQIAYLPENNFLANYASEALAFNNEFYFVGKNSGNFDKLFKVTSADNIVQVANVRGDGNHDSPSGLTAYDGELYFRMRNSGGALKLHKLGVDGRIHQVMDQNGGSDDTIDAIFVSTSGLFVATSNPWRLIRVRKE